MNMELLTTVCTILGALCTFFLYNMFVDFKTLIKVVGDLSTEVASLKIV